MSFSFNIFSAGGGSGMSGGGSGISKYATAAALPAVAADGDIAIVLDTNNLYSYDTGVAGWVIIGGPGVAITVSDTSSVNLTLAGNVLSADLNIGSTTLPANTIGISLLIQPTGSTGLYGYAAASGSNLASGTTNGFLSAVDWTKFNNNLGASTILQTVFPIFGGTYLPSNGGITLSIPAANGTTGGYLTTTDWNIFNSKMPGITYLFWVGASYPTVQSAVNAAQLLPQAYSATLPSGICVFLPQGVWDETVTVTGNINLLGMGGWQSRLDRLVLKPLNATLCPQNITISGVHTESGAIIINDAGAGVFNPFMGQWSIRFEGCLLFGMTVMNVNSLELQTTKVFNDLNVSNAVSMNFVNSQNDSLFTFLIDDSLPNTPDGLTIGFNGLISDHSLYNALSLETGASSTLQSIHTSFEDSFQDYTAGLSTQLWFMNSPIANFTDSGAEFLNWQDRSQYTPSTPGNWSPAPQFTNDALDQLSAASGITTGTFNATSFTKGMTLFNKILTLGPADASNPGSVSTSAQSFIGVKAFDSGFIRLKQTGAGSTYLDIGMGAAITGYTLVMPSLQGGTFSTFYNNGLGVLSFGIPGAYNGYITVSNAGATLALQTRMVEITTGVTNQTLNIGYAASGNTGAWFNAIKIDSGLGSVTVQTPDLINGVSNFTFSSQWEAHKFVCNGIGWRVIT